MKRKTEQASPQRAVLWLPVCGLAAMQGAITLTWLIYNLYLPQLIVQLGLTKQLAEGLLIIENALAVVMEPLMGGLSDRAKRWVGTTCRVQILDCFRLVLVCSSSPMGKGPRVLVAG